MTNVINLSELNSFVGKDGFKKVEISSDAAMQYTELFFKEGNVRAITSLIPYDHKTATVIHFVSNTEGGEYGQFSSKTKALESAEIIAKLSEVERRALEV